MTLRSGDEEQPAKTTEIRRRGYRSKSKSEIAAMYAALDGGMPIEKVEKKFGVKRGTLYVWRRQDRKAAAARVAPITNGRAPDPAPLLTAVGAIAKTLSPFDDGERRRIFAAVLCLFEDNQASATLGKRSAE
jgi:transposase-like protein